MRAKGVVNVNSSMKMAFTILAYTAISPKTACRLIKARTSSLLPMVVLIMSIGIGGFLTSPAARHIDALTIQHSQEAGANTGSAADHAQDVRGAETFKPSQFATNVLFLSVLILVLLLIEATVMNVFAMVFGTPSFSRSLSATLNIAAIVFGGYLLLNGCLTQLIGANHFESYPELNRVTPSLLFLYPEDTAGFLNGFLSALNPFTVAAAYLIYRALTITLEVKNNLASGIFAIFLALSAAGLQGIAALGG